MNAIPLLGSAMGLGLFAGLRLYATVLAIGLAVRFNLIQLHPAMADLRVLADGRILAAASVAYVMEFLADKVPWVDSLWDAVHTIIRPAGAAILAATAFGNVDPVLHAVLVLVCGGVALSGHSTKAAARLAVNHSPEPFSNIALSLAGDVAAPAGAWLVLTHPYLVFGIVLGFLAAFAWLAPKVFRIMRVEITALRGLVERWLRPPTVPVPALPEEYSSGAIAAVVPELRARLRRVPEWCLRYAGGAGGVKCSATAGIKGLKSSVGYLCFEPAGLVFAARRLFRVRRFAVPLETISGASFGTGLLLDRLTIDTEKRPLSFDVFKSPRRLPPDLPETISSPGH